MNIPSLHQLCEKVTSVASIINDSFGRPTATEFKGDQTPVTIIDHQINERLCTWAHELGVGFLGEEGNGREMAEYYLYVDPLDGTGAFLRGMATSTTIASIMRRDGQYGRPLMTVIRNPVTDETWCAEHRYGAYYSRGAHIDRITVIPPTDTEQRRVTLCTWPGSTEQFKRLETRVSLNPRRYEDQKLGALGIGGALVAAGRMHATAVGPTSALEVAAMSLLVREAGGACIDLRGKTLTCFELGTYRDKPDFILPHGAIVACSEEIAAELQDLYGP